MPQPARSTPAVPHHASRRRASAPVRLAALLLAVTHGPGLAAASGSELPSSAFDRAAALARELAQARAPAQARVVALAGAPDARLKLAPCADIRVEPSPGAPAWGRTRVLLRCADGPGAWRIAVPVTVQVWAPAWLAAAPRAAGDTLAIGQLVPGVTDWAAAATPPLPLSADPQGRVLARPLSAGEPLREADLRARQWFVAGDTVRVTATGPGFAVRAEAQAVSPGIEGRPARLKNSSGRVFVATPVGERQAEVNL